MSIHTDVKMGKDKSNTKVLSKKAYTNILPNAIINKMKTGWTVPVGHWLTQNMDQDLQNFYKQRMQTAHKLDIVKASQKAGKAVVPAWIYKDWMIKYNLES